MNVFAFIRRQIVPPVALCCFVLFGSQSVQATTTGGRLTVSGTINGTTAVNFSLLDSQIHSGAARTSPCDGISTDAYVLNGGSPNGCDNGDAFETTQAAGNADVSGFHIKTFYQFGGCNTKGTICASPDTGFLTVTNNTVFAFTGTITLGGTSPVTGAVSDSWTSGLAAGSSVTLALSNESSNDGGFNAGDQCSAPTVGIGSGAVGTATGLNTCGVVITVTQVDGSGNALAYSVAPSNPPGNNGNPYDSGDDTLVGIQNNSGTTLNSMVLASSDTSFGGLLAFDGDGACNALFHTPAYPWCSNTGFTGYEGPDNTFSNIMSTSCPIFVTCATSGTVHFTTGIPNGGSTWLALEASSAQNLTPPTMQVVTTSAVDFTTTTNSIVPVTFNNTPGQLVRGDADFPLNNLSFPGNINPATVKFLETNRFVPNCQPYTIGTPFATCIPFDHAGNDALAGTTGNGAKYEIICGDANNTPSEANCPTPNTGKHIRFKDIFDLPTNGSGFIQPAIAPGTTVSFAHSFPNFHPDITSWSPSSTSPHPACTNVFTATFACDIEDALVNKYGPSNGSGSDARKGDYLLVYNIPMLCSAVKVNGMPVNTPCAQGSSTFFFHSPLKFDFVVSPAKCNPALPVACGNGWIPAPPNTIFHTFDPLSSAPDLPGATDFEDFITCPAPPGTNCNDVITGTPGASNTANLEFTTPALIEPEGQFLLQWSAADTVKIRERNIQLLPLGSPIPCPNPFPNDPNIPAGGPAHPCYSTKLFNVPIDVDNTPPNVSTPVLSPSPVNGTYAVGQPGVTASVNCVDVVSGGVASSVVLCGNKLVPPAPFPPNAQTPVNSPSNPVPTGSAGKQNFTVSAADQAGNVGTSPGVPYCVGYTISSVDRNAVVGFTAPVDNPPAVNLVGSSQAIPLSLTVVDCNGNPVSNLDLVGSTNVGTVKTVVLSATNAPSGTCASAVMDNSISTGAAGSSGWQILGNGVYDYNWKPMAPVGSCIAFSVNLGDNIQHTALFNVVRK